MALVASTLDVQLSRALTPRKGGTMPQIAKAMADAYTAYASAAQAGAALPVFLGTEGQGFALALSQVVAASGNPASYGQTLGNAITAFWTASPAPVLFTDGVNSGVAPPPAGIAALISAVTAATSNPRTTKEAAAKAIAQALDLATRTIIIPLVPSGIPTPLV